MDDWLREAKSAPTAPLVGMYLFHNGVVRRTPRATVRHGQEAPPVAGMLLTCDEAALQAAIAQAKQLPGIYYVRVWINQGRLSVGDDLMYILLGGDTRPHTVEAMQTLLTQIKQTCLTEQELPE